MKWKNEELKTWGDIMRVVEGIVKRNDQAEANQFIELYEAENPHARENIGYAAVYCGTDIAAKIHEMFGAKHPVFGKISKDNVPTPEEAFAMGEAMVEKKN